MLPAEVVHVLFKLETGIIGPSQLVGDMFSQTFHDNKDGAQDRSLLRLPLNLVALIIRHVRAREAALRRSYQYFCD